VKDNIMDDATNKFNISLKYRDNKSTFTSDHEDGGFTSLEFGNVIRIQSICEHVTYYL
jgi:hypothetical protein